MIRIFAKYRCMTCPDQPWIGETADAEAHLADNIGHELTQRLTSEDVEEVEE